MHKRARHWSIWLQVAIIALTAGAISVSLIAVEEQPAGKDDLKIAVAQLRSAAAEGQLLAEQTAAQHLTSTYLKSHVQRQQQELSSLTDELSTMKVSSEIEESLAKATVLSRQLNDLMGTLLIAGWVDSSDSFQELEASLQDLENSLKD